MNRLALSTAAVAVAMILGCSSPSDTQSTEQATDSTESALDGLHCDADVDIESTCDGAGPKAYTLISVDGSLLTGVNGFGQTINVTVTTATKFKPANLHQHFPGDPSFVMPLLQAYNTAIQNHGNVLEAVSTLQSLTARIGIKPGATTAFSFRPVP